MSMTIVYFKFFLSVRFAALRYVRKATYTMLLHIVIKDSGYNIPVLRMTPRIF